MNPNLIGTQYDEHYNQLVKQLYDLSKTEGFNRADYVWHFPVEQLEYLKAQGITSISDRHYGIDILWLDIERIELVKRHGTR